MCKEGKGFDVTDFLVSSIIFSLILTSNPSKVLFLLILDLWHIDFSNVYDK